MVVPISLTYAFREVYILVSLILFNTSANSHFCCDHTVLSRSPDNGIVQNHDLVGLPFVVYLGTDSNIEKLFFLSPITIGCVSPRPA